MYLVVKSRRSNDKERDKSDVEVPENNSVNEEATAQTKLEENYTAENQNHLLDQGANAEQDSMDENNSVNQERDAATDAGNGETEKSAYDKTQSCMTFFILRFIIFYYKKHEMDFFLKLLCICQMCAT